MNTNRIKELLSLQYPTTACFLNHTQNYELLFAIILSAQTTDKAVNKVTEHLFKRYPSLEEFSHATLKDLSEELRELGLWKVKAKYLLDNAQYLFNKLGGTMPTSKEELLKLSGVGEKTASVYLGELSLSNEFPVDTHVFRVAHKLKLVPDEVRNPTEVSKVLKELFKGELLISLHRQFILLGRDFCHSSKPSCSSCPLGPVCPSKE